MLVVEVLVVEVLVVEVFVNKVDEFDDVVTVLGELDPVVVEGMCDRIGCSRSFYDIISCSACPFT